MFFDADDLNQYAKLPTKRARFDGPFKRLHYAPVHREFVSGVFNLPVRSEAVCDVECLPNYFLVAFKHLATGQYFYYEYSPDCELDRAALHRALYWFKIYTFNGRGYDIPMIEAACKGASLSELKQLSDEIILEDKRVASFNSKIDHIDLIEVAPLEGSLKLYAARLHCKRMQEMGIDPHQMISYEESLEIRDYCFNDLDNTELLLCEPKWGLRQYIELREKLGERYGVDLRSKSDAQVAEAVINAELRKRGVIPRKPEFDAGFAFKYEAPEFIHSSGLMGDILPTVEGATFYLNGGGAPDMPAEIADLVITIGGNAYKMGMGGLHSQEKSIAHKADAETDLVDRDVASFYPRIILNNRYYPEHLGSIYLEVYGGIVELRLELKRAGDKMEASLKIVINGTFGKQGNMYSTIYAPKLLIGTTMTGQLSLLLLIRMLEMNGIAVVSANTDGVVIKARKSQANLLAHVIALWEENTGFVTEETRYAAIYSRDVNNYIAVKEDGTCKPKGCYSEKGSALNSPLSKNPEALIVSDAIQAFITRGVLIEDTIRACTDIRKFVIVRNVKGGGHKDGWFLGKVVRYYYADEVTGIIQYCLSGNKVKKTEGAKPCMELPDTLPADVDFSKYIDLAYEELENIGYWQRPKQGRLF